MKAVRKVLGPRRIVGAALASSAVALAVPAAAGAAPSSVGVSAGTLLFQAGPRTSNVVELQHRRQIAKGGTGPLFFLFAVFERGAAVTLEPATGCSDFTATEATCLGGVTDPAPELRLIRVLLGDGDDSVLFTNRVGEGAADPTVTPIRINGGPGNDRMTAADGADVIVGGPGVNTARGGGGNDRLLMRNGRHDTLIDCGVGIDTAVIDREDPRPIACETVLRP